MQLSINASPPRRSAVGLTVRKKGPSSASSGIFDRLKSLQAALGPEANKHDRALILISACISEGVDTSAAIIGALARLGLNTRHVAITLKQGTGTSIERHRWKAADGRYTLLG